MDATSKKNILISAKRYAISAITLMILLLSFSSFGLERIEKDTDEDGKIDRIIYVNKENRLSLRLTATRMELLTGSSIMKMKYL